MSALLIGAIVVIVMTMVFAFTNGFHDAANAIATSVSTRALPPRVALLMAALGNLVGSFLGAKVAGTVGEGIVSLPPGTKSLVVVFAGLVGAVVWNLITWYFGLPASSSHSLIGGLVGATLAALSLGLSGQVLWSGILDKVIVPMIISPVIGLVVGYLVMLAVMWTFRRSAPGRLNRGFRFAQTGSAALMALGHGMQDAAKSMGIVVLALNISGIQHDHHIPWWVYLLTAGVMAAGTYSGGWRVIRTLGRRIIHLDPPQGFAAELSGAAVLFGASIGFGVPISTTHTITAAIMGVGATKRLSAVRWGVAGNIVVAWVLTLPAAGLFALVVYYLAHLILG
ncbi:inorganic phosphate transporter [Actinocatenispora thailandica]|uniref:inorganic phosphate transporter n=1 Tax=Actinocatenispora thailandica TaxID=227318 RepID=UPI0031D32730